MSKEKIVTHECAHCSGTGKQKTTITIEDVDSIRDRVDADLTELAERVGELLSRVDTAGEEFEDYVARIQAGDYRTDNIAGIMTDSLGADLNNIEQEVDAVRSVLRDFEESNLDLQAALEDEADGS